MSALGQKQTSELIQSLSALPPKADIRTAPALRAAQETRQLGVLTAIRRASSLVSSFGCRSPAGLILEIDIRQLLPGVDHDEARF
jgi:hypothetical protein